MEQGQKAKKLVRLDTARAPQKPVRPNRPVLMVAGMLVSLLTAGLMAFLLELKENVILGEWELPPETSVVGWMPRMEIETK
jgi:uncharacterized protein involved in exopolysaccharide biosynthesis